MTESPTLRIFIFFLTAFLSVSSGIIASSDGGTIFKVTEAIVERGEISVSGEHLQIGAGGRSVSHYGIALSVVAIPLYVAGKLVSSFIPEQLRTLSLKGIVSLTNAIVSALACLFLFLTAQKLDYSARVSLQLTASLAFSTFFAVYATKSFLTQPLETLCLAGTLYCLIAHSRVSDRRMLLYAGCFSGGGVLTKWAFVINLPILVAYLLAIPDNTRRARNLSIFLAPVGVSLALALWYNYARFGSILETGTRVSEFSTPLFVGLYGLLFSSGKSLFLYAPIALLGLASMKAFSNSHKRETWLMLGLFTGNLLLIAKISYWGGEGSWGPRYLTLILPCLVLPIGSLFRTGSIAVRRTFLALTLVGLLVQVGGVSVYYGTYYRVIGEYPYRTDFSDPLFMYKTRYVPNYSPAAGQLRMAHENWGNFLSGKKPSLKIDPGRQRIPLSEADLEKLRETLDLWFAYVYYAGVPFGLCLLGMTTLMGAAATMGWRLHRWSKGQDD